MNDVVAVAAVNRDNRSEIVNGVFTVAALNCGVVRITFNAVIVDVGDPLPKDICYDVVTCAGVD